MTALCSSIVLMSALGLCADVMMHALSCMLVCSKLNF